MTKETCPNPCAGWALLGLLATFSGCAPAAPTSPGKPPTTGYKFEISVDGAKTSGHASTFAVQQNGQSVQMKDGRLTMNGKNYGSIPAGATIVIENQRVKVNGAEKSPE